MAEYILDLRGAKLPEWWPESAPLEIPICDGRYYSEYDVVEDKIPGFRGMIKISQRRRIPEKTAHKNSTMPIGFNEHELPYGSQIRAL